MNARQKKLAGVIAFAFVIALSAWRLLPSREPAYNGKTLSSWAWQYHSNHWPQPLGNAAEKEAEFAIRQIGTNAIPLLLDLVRTRDSAMKYRLRRALPISWWEQLHLDQTGGELRRVGAHGLVALNTNAAPAVPALIELATHHPMDDGPYPDGDGRYIVRFALQALGPTAEAAIPFFIQSLTNSASWERVDAVTALGKIQRRPEIVVPALIAYVEFAKSLTDDEVAAAIYPIAEFGTNAKSAAPVFVSLLKHPSPQVREYVTNGLPRIDAEAAAKAQVKRPQ